ncbi:tyrosine-type recombinase/integrase [Curtobacterium sp. YC1]|uniref:tyrosine-type recombinase/integrase n=1 Tax=Curtobacterium sp. YC1 TaxID=2795488 RepID=UPI001E4FAB67|nr:tyrosine-type recombinase/integrase [Curtobacterium sp. YC1]
MSDEDTQHHATFVHEGERRFIYAARRDGARGLVLLPERAAEAQRALTKSELMVNGQHVLGSVKSHERRSVGFPDFLDSAVAAACRDKHPDDRLWSSSAGGFLRPGHSSQGWFTKAVQRTMAADASFRRVTPYDLRHTAASLAISAGANVKVVQRMLSHKSAKVTLDTYAALFPDDLDNVTSALSRQRAEQL